jgi:predicted DNA-binding protein
MGEEEDTSVRVKAETWKRLDELKDSPGKTFDDVINELLDESESSSGNRSPADPVLAD